MRQYKVAIAGATGVVGREMMKVLEEREFPVRELVPLASERSEGQNLEFMGGEVTVQRLKPDSFAGADIALFSPGATVSREFAPHAARAGAVVIDNSSAFRMDADCPLVVPEVNPRDVDLALKPGGRRIIANPNCSTIQLVVVLKPLHEAAGLERVIVSTYQSVSGAGQKGIDELEKQARALFNLEATANEKFPHRIAFNLLPEIGKDSGNGYTDEEMKLVNESRKILGLPGLAVSATCVRVPVFYCHSEAAHLFFKRPLAPDQAREILRKAAGVKVVDELKEHVYPMPLLGAGNDDTLVGRIRSDLSAPNGLALFVVSDNLRKGAATNAVQIAELLARDYADKLSARA
ncbi:MAG: aspartate-semialdehyde dehydrogenase [Deltaproteobacteria bacterium]|nr:MAG: aspartate-semialdehyde dehydrogenase [Deltaproteobacteria bacterium]TMB36768.1 MAG: aspartate-semialdehyde dehydrogenase [Deltaproteobacteria bacterium]